MVALTVTEVPQLKALVAAADGEAFVIVSPAQGVFGKGFMPLEEGSNENTYQERDADHCL